MLHGSCVVAIYSFTICFAYSWGPCVWCLCSEIFPTAQRKRETFMFCAMIGKFVRARACVGMCMLAAGLYLKHALLVDRSGAKGVSITTTTNWTFGIAISQFVPVLQDSLGFGLFFIFSGFCVIMAGFTMVMVPETQGISIDAVAQLEPWSCYHRKGKSVQTQPLLR